MFAALAHGRRAFSWGSTVVAFWGRALLSARIPSSSSCLHCVHWGLFGVEGLLAASGFTKKMWLHLFCRVEKACYANLVALRVLPMLQNGVSVLGSRWGGQLCARFDRVLVLAVRVCRALRLQLFLRMRLRLLYLCLRAWPPCCRKCRWCCCLSRCVGVGQGPRSPPAFCRAGHRAPGGKLHVSLCRCSAFAPSANVSL